MRKGQGRRIAMVLALTAVTSAWASYWADRFFAARARAEEAMDVLQLLLGRGLSDPALVSEVDEALAESHRALAFALGGPILIVLGAAGAVWLILARRSRRWEAASRPPSQPVE
jgi:hypothetical protein